MLQLKVLIQTVYSKGREYATLISVLVQLIACNHLRFPELQMKI